MNIFTSRKEAIRAMIEANLTVYIFNNLIKMLDKEPSYYDTQEKVMCEKRKEELER